jgi:murein DD-endopeptidase MepM/ murein hydrolase activator NlpD
MVRKAGIRLIAIGLILSLFIMVSPPLHRVLGATLEEKQAEAEKVKAQIDNMKAESQRLAQEYNAALDQVEAMRLQVESNRQQLDKAQSDYRKARMILNDTLRSIYKSGDVNSLEVLLESTSLDDLLSRYDFFQYIGSRDQQVFQQCKKLQEEIGQKQRDLEEEQVQQQQLAASLNAKQQAMEASIQQQQTYLDSVNKEILTLLAQNYNTGAGGGNPYPTSIGNFIFPVRGPHSFSNDWHAPRTGHLHQGCDVFAALGTPCVACVTGTVNLGSGGNAGNYVRLVADNGDVFYYMHLNAFAATGHVPAGTVIGYVGNTGNAAGGPCHLHFEIHPGGGAAIPPYPILLASDH